ncbi:MAG: DciA family protein [Candidatus Nanopelagicales bacterium]
MSWPGRCTVSSDGSSDGPDQPPPGASGELDLARSAFAAARQRAARDQPRPDQRVRRTRRQTSPLVSGAGEDDRDPQPLGRSVDRLLTDRGWQTEVAVAGAVGRWEEVVGAEVAAHVTPSRFEDQVLYVRADSSAWATQMTYLAPSVVRRLNDELGAGTVLRLEVQGPVGPTWRKGGYRVAGRGPRDTYG